MYILVIILGLAILSIKSVVRSNQNLNETKMFCADMIAQSRLNIEQQKINLNTIKQVRGEIKHARENGIY